jgi:hypothetical protein
MKNSTKIAVKKNEKGTEKITLYAFRTNETWYNMITTLKDSKGKVKAVIGGNLKQPRKGVKQIVINGNRFTVNWDNVN